MNDALYSGELRCSLLRICRLFGRCICLCRPQKTYGKLIELTAIVSNKIISNAPRVHSYRWCEAMAEALWNVYSQLAGERLTNNVRAVIVVILFWSTYNSSVQTEI